MNQLMICFQTKKHCVLGPINKCLNKLCSSLYVNFIQTEKRNIHHPCPFFKTQLSQSFICLVTRTKRMDGPTRVTGLLTGSTRITEAQNPKPHRYRAFSLMQQSEMASLSNFRWQNREERPNISTNNGFMVDKAKSDVVSEIILKIRYYL